MDDLRPDQPHATMNLLAQSWWYRLYFSPPALSAGLHGVVRA